MRLRNEAKVGLIVFIGILALVFVYWFLGGLRLRTASYSIYGIFPDALKLDRGAVVRMAGVQVGVVSKTALVGTRARVDMLIDNQVRIPSNSAATITTGGFIGENYVEIDPGTSDDYLRSGARIRTRTQVQPEELMEQANLLLQDLRQSTRGINQLLGDERMVDTLKDTVRQLNQAARSASQLAATTQGLVSGISPRVDTIMTNLESASAVAASTSADVQDLVATDLRPNLRSLLRQTGGLAENLNAAITQARLLMNELGGRSGSLDEALAEVNRALDNVTAATEQAEQTMANLNEASASVRDLATDAEVNENIRQTLRNAAAASAQAGELLENINRRIGGRRTAYPAPARPRPPEEGTSVNSLWNTDTGDYRFDAYYTYFAGNSVLYRAGAYNIGETTRAILQAGNVLGPGALRYGIYASRIGVGYDYGIGRSAIISADLFRPNDPELEIRGILGVRGPYGIYAGVSDVFHEDNRDLLVGVRYQR